MFYMRDLYPNFVSGTRTGEKTVPERLQDGFQIKPSLPAKNEPTIWLTLAVLIGIVIAIGFVNR